MPKVIVIGSINMDVVALTTRHPRGGETVKGHELHLLPGGKGANQAVAARRANAETLMVGRLGGDAFADELERFLVDEGVDLSYTERVPDAPTGTAIIAVAGGENTIVIVPGANDRLGPADVLGLPIDVGDIVVAQFEVPQDTIAAAFASAQAAGATTVLNPAPAADCDPALLAATDILVLNETELATLRGTEDSQVVTSDDGLVHAGEMRVRPDQAVILTLGAAGAVAVTPDGTMRVDGHPVDVVDTTGAGDCFVGNLAAELSRGAALDTAIRTANLAASLCVQVVGAGVSMPRLEDVLALPLESL